MAHTLRTEPWAYVWFIKSLYLWFELVLQALALAFLVEQRQSRWSNNQDKDVLITMFAFMGAQILGQIITIVLSMIRSNKKMRFNPRENVYLNSWRPFFFCIFNIVNVALIQAYDLYTLFVTSYSIMFALMVLYIFTLFKESVHVRLIQTLLPKYEDYWDMFIPQKVI